MKAVRVLYAAALCSATNVQAFATSSTGGARRGFAGVAGSAMKHSSRASNGGVGGSTTRLMLTVALTDFVNQEVADNKVVIFSKTYCPFCTATKDLFAGLGVEAKIIELDNMANGSEIQAALQELSGQRTVPNTFVDGKHLGGNEDVQKAALFGDLKKQLGL